MENRKGHRVWKLLTEKAGGSLGSRRHSQIERAGAVKREGARDWQRSEMAFQKNEEKS